MLGLVLTDLPGKPLDEAESTLKQLGDLVAVDADLINPKQVTALISNIRPLRDRLSTQVDDVSGKPMSVSCNAPLRTGQSASGHR